MFRVSMIHLSADASSVDAARQSVDLGSLPRADLLLLLGRLSTLGPEPTGGADPRLIVATANGEFVIRPGNSKLVVTAEHLSAPPQTLDPGELIALLEGAAAPSGTSADSDLRPKRDRKKIRRLAAAALLLVTGLALHGYALAGFFKVESISEPTRLELVTNPVEINAVLRATSGNFATGTKPGDRTIAVSPDGSITFSEIGSRNSIVNNRDRYQLARREKSYCLATDQSGVVEIFDNDTLIYFRDRYRRH